MRAGTAMLLCRRSLLLHRDVGEVAFPHVLPFMIASEPYYSIKLKIVQAVFSPVG
jgi:hypothetical protein